METIETGIQNIDAHTNEAIQKHKDLLAKTIFETAKKSKMALKTFEKQCADIFTDVNQIGTESTEAFNPHTIVELRDGKCHQVIDNWNKTDGILPDRKVMGKYFIDVVPKFDEKVNENESKKKYFVPNNNTIYDYFMCPGCNSGDVKSTMSCNHTSGHFRLEPFAHPFSTNYEKNISIIETNPLVIKKYLMAVGNNNIIQRGESRNYIFDFDGTITFEVDNYLNLYHKPSGLYLMFHKTPFPDACFYFAREYNQLPDKDYFQIFLSKRLEEFNFDFTQSNYNSLDNRSKMLEEINKMVPENYGRIFKLFNNFRKFNSFGSNSNQLELDTETKKTNIIDPKDRIIESLRLKMNETIKRCENSEQIVSEMTDEYNQKSVELQKIRSEMGLLEIQIKEQQVEFENKLLSETEKIKCDNYGLFKRLSEAEVFKAKSESLGISITQLQTNFETETINKEKLKNMNTKLIDSVKEERVRNLKLKTNNDDLFKQMTSNQNELDDFKVKLNSIEHDLKKKNEECWHLGEKLSKIGNNSSDVLNNALSDRINDLEQSMNTLKEEKQTILEQKNKIKNEYDKIKSVISTLCP